MIAMSARHLSQEAHLWYTLTSADYVAQAKTRLQEAVDFMQERVLKHPFIAGYAPVPHWGGVMQDLLDRFDNALAIMRQGEFGPMQDWTSRMSDIPRGFQETNLEWLSRPDQDVFMDRLNQASSIGGDFLRAVAMSQTYSDPSYKNGGNDWLHEIPEDMGIPSNYIVRYYEPYIFAKLPERIPEYAPDPSITCKTGEIVPWTGVWVPSTGMGTAALAFARQHLQVMQPAYEVAQIDEDNDITQFTLIDCTWHAVKPTGRMIELNRPGFPRHP